MNRALSLVLAGLLVILPVEQVLAQAVQQEAVSMQQAVPSGGAANLFRVPPLTENSARLLRASSDRALLSNPFADAPLAQENPDENWFKRQSFGVKLLLLVGFLGVLLLIGSTIEL